jgi:hypothetical protein
MAYEFNSVKKWIVSSFTISRELTEQGPPANMINVTISLGDYKYNEDGSIAMYQGGEIWKGAVRKTFNANMQDIMMFLMALQPTNGEPIIEQQLKFHGPSDPILDIDGVPVIDGECNTTYHI